MVSCEKTEVSGPERKVHDGKVYSVRKALEEEKAGAERGAARHLEHEPRDAEAAESEGVQQSEGTEMGERVQFCAFAVS